MKGPKRKLAGFYQKVLMDDMMQVVGVDLLDVVDFDGGQSYIRARANCGECACKTACRTWLSGRSQGTPQPFCPNADFFQTVKSAC